MNADLAFAEPDITLHLDLDGVVRDVTLAASLSGEDTQPWVGHRWTETVGGTGVNQVERIVRDACDGGISAFRHVTQRFPSGLELPMEYTVVRLGGAAGLVAVGKSLQAVAELQSRLVAAQQAMERDYWKLRDVETRYRLLFDASNEAVVMINADSLSVVEANPAAIRALGISPVGRDLASQLKPDAMDVLNRVLSVARADGKSSRSLVRLGPDGKTWFMKASLMTRETGKVFLLQIAPADAMDAEDPDTLVTDRAIAFDQSPDGIVVIDANGMVSQANPAFLDLIQVGSEQQAIGKSLGTWLSRPGADVAVLLSGTKRHGEIRLFATAIEGELGTVTDVEISAMDGGAEYPGQTTVILRDVGLDSRRSVIEQEARTIILPTAGQISKRNLSALVDDIVGTVERYCIISALEITGQNRTAAAELLGLSRQSLYLKLGRYEIKGGSRKKRANKS